MLENVIPSFSYELERIGEIGTSGFVIGFGLRFGKPDFFLNRYPEPWTQRYEEKNYFFGDPVAAWTIARTGKVRWSEIKFPDIRNVMDDAASFGLKHGATAVTVIQRRRSFISVARPDRDVTDAELDHMLTSITRWASIVGKTNAALTEAEVEVLALLAGGLTYSGAADVIGVSASALRVRVNSAQKKLGTTNLSSTIAVAARRQLI